MAALVNNGEETYWIDGEPLPNVYRLSSGEETYWIAGEPIPALSSAGTPTFQSSNFLFMFFDL